MLYTCTATIPGREPFVMFAFCDSGLAAKMTCRDVVEQDMSLKATRISARPATADERAFCKSAIAATFE